jgi:molecular chaperone DnaK
MRTRIDYGIDLGTTNSAIARMENGVPVIKKSDTLKDTLPSCVHFNRRRDTLVGDSGINTMMNEYQVMLRTFTRARTNSFIEFKRTMGTTHRYESSNMGNSFLSEELSAEVLKKLKEFITDEKVLSIVITVPAKFLNPQKEATVNAARLAGFEHIELLQEPVAAATAYGLNAQNKDAFWIVFDFGGGTFDAALVKSEEGILTVKDTDGDNWLGGKNIDEAIVDQLIIPHLKEKYAINFILEDTEKKEMLRNAIKSYAEAAKIQLSFKDSHRILSNLGELQFTDENGEEPEIDLVVTQKDMDGVVTPIFQKAIDITKNLMTRNNLTRSDIGTLILVGGPTYSPILKRMLKEQVADIVDTSIDPMTAVAKGAALFASTLAVSDNVMEASRDNTKLQLEVKYEATSVDTAEMVTLKILKNKTAGQVPSKVYAEIRRFDAAWSSGKKLIVEKATPIDVHLLPDRSNSFDILVYDDLGNMLECEPAKFSILQGIDVGEMTTLPYHIGLGVFFDEDGKDLFQPIKGLEKNKRIPSTGVINGLKTRQAIRAGSYEDKIRIPIYQGDYNAEGSNPMLNNIVNEIIITGEKLPGALPKGSDVDITIKVDRSEQMQFTAFFPLLGYTEELKVDIKNTEPPSESWLLTEIDKAKAVAKSINSTAVIKNLDKLVEQLEHGKGSVDDRLQLLDSLRKERLKLENEEKIAEWPKVREELRKTFREFEEISAKMRESGMDKQYDMVKIDTLTTSFRVKVEHVIKEKLLRDAKALTLEIGKWDFSLRNMLTDNAGDASLVNHFHQNFNEYNWRDPARARTLVNEGIRAVTNGNNKALPSIVDELFTLMPEKQWGDTLELAKKS